MKGNYATRRQAMSKARQLRKNFPRLKPVKAKRWSDGSYDVVSR
jgi:hypothetical protein